MKRRVELIGVLRMVSECEDACDFRYSCEKTFSDSITLLKWSEKRDLLAMATESGQVLLHRFEKLERAWKFKSLDAFPNAKITSLCWRADGRVICVAYAYTDDATNEESAFFKLLTEEGPVDLMEEIALPARAMSLTWTESNYVHDIDTNLSFFPELSKIGKREQTHLDALVDSNLNVLIVTLNTGEIAGYGYGVVPLFLYNTGANALDAVISPKLDLIHVTCRSNDTDMLVHMMVGTQKLTDYHAQIHRYVCFVITAQLWYG